MRFLAGLLFAALLPSAGAARADAVHAGREEATRFVKEAVAAIRHDGREKAFARFDDPYDAEFHRKDLRVIVYDLTGRCIANGAAPDLVGRNLWNWQDADGRPTVRARIRLARTRGGGWLDFSMIDPATQTAVRRAAYVEKAGDLVVGVEIGN